MTSEIPQPSSRRSGEIEIRLILTLVACVSLLTFCNSVCLAQGLAPLGRLESKTGNITSAAFLSDGKTVLGGSYQEVLVAPLDDLSQHKCWTGFKGYVSQLAITPDGNLCACGQYQKITLVSVADGSIQEQLAHHRGQITGLKFLDQDHLVSVADDGTVARWTRDADSNTWKVTEKKTFDDPVNGLAVDLTGKNLLVAIGDETRVTRPGKTVCLNLETLEEKWETELHRSATTCLAVTSEGKSVLSGSFDETIIRSSLATGEAENIFRGHVRTVNCMVVHPSLPYVVSGSGGRNKGKNELLVWNLETGAIPVRLESHQGKVTCVALTADGKTLASGGADKVLLIYDLEQFLSSLKPVE